MAEPFVGDLPVLLGSRPKPLEETLREIEKSPQQAEKSPADEAQGRRRNAPAPLEFSGESECPERDELWFFVKNTFLEGSRMRSPSLERFYKERSVHTCPGQQIGRLRQLESDSPRNKENSVRVWEGLQSPATGFETPILEDLPVLFGRGAPAPATTFSSSSSATTWTTPLAPPPYPPPELELNAGSSHAVGPPASSMSLLSTQPPADRVASASPVLAPSASPTMSATSMPATSLEAAAAAVGAPWELPWDSPTPSLGWDAYLPDHSYLHGSPQAPWTSEPMSFPYTPYFPMTQAASQSAVGATGMHPQQHLQQQHLQQQHLQQQQQQAVPQPHGNGHQAGRLHPQKQVLSLSAAADYDDRADQWWHSGQQSPQSSTAANSQSRPVLNLSAALVWDEMPPPAQKPLSAAALGARSIEALLHPSTNASASASATSNCGASANGASTSTTASTSASTTLPAVPTPAPAAPAAHQGHGPHHVPKRSSPGAVATWQGTPMTRAQEQLSNLHSASPAPSSALTQVEATKKASPGPIPTATLPVGMVEPKKTTANDE